MAVCCPFLLLAAGPGTNGTATLCSNGAPVQLIDYLGGSPDPGGTWSGPALHPGTFDPATDAPGVYTYTIAGPPVQSATVTVVVHALPQAGSNGSLVACSSGAAVPLLAQLGGTPDPDGTWSGPAPVPGGLFNPATMPGGTYTYTVTGTPPCPNATANVVVTVNAQPSAGSPGTLVTCSNSAPTALLAHLGGSPSATGTWSGPSAVTGGQFDPATMLPGTYTYTVAGTPPCANATATVEVTVNPLPNAGTSGTLTVCSNGAPVDLFTVLGGTPDHGGVWTLGGNPVSGMFSPGTSAAGTYVYTVNGTPPCPNATANVVVTVVPAPVAGDSRSITVCSNDAPFSMRANLGGTPDAGGTWTPGGSNTFTPGTSAAGVYTYVVAGTAPCANDTARLTIVVREAPDAGTGRSIAVCSNGAIFNLADSLGGTPDGGGTWTGPGGAHSGQFKPGIDPAGPYQYLVAGQAPCAPAMATVTVTVRPAPNAGTSTNVVKCSNAAQFTLISQLGGTPQSTGTWTGPGGTPFPSGDFIPGTTPPGLYTYTVTGQSPCQPAVATVNVSIVTAPNAGTPATVTVCSSDGSFSLASKLGGTPGVGGTWTGPGGVAWPSGTFTPGVSPAGIYTYRVAGTSPCADATATVTVNVVEAANAGGNGTVTLCSTSPNENLFNHLGGTPQSGGIWTKPTPPGGTLAGGIYKPSDPTHPAGTYTYTVNGTAPCPNASASVLVVENQAPNAGTTASTTLCSTNPPFNMRDVLGGTPDAGGTWINASNGVVPATFTPGTTTTGVYRYVVAGLAPCPNDTAQLTVNVNTAPNAGLNGAAVVCSDDAPVDLFLLLGGTPNSGGTWKDPSNATNNGSFVPGAGALQGGYTYRVQGQSPCADATAVVTITQHTRPKAGTSVTVPLCSTDPAVNLFERLGGSPDAGGSWTGPGGTPTNGIFMPGAAGTFVYKYKVTGTAPCRADSALVTVSVTKAPEAGVSGTITICSGQPSVDLFNGLGGTPDMNGTWSEITVTGRLSSHFFNPGTPTQLPAGDYDFRYVVPPSGLCAGDTSQVRVTIVPVLIAGNNGSRTVCSSETQVNLFTALGGTPQPGGAWEDLDATGLVTGQYFNANGAGPGTYHFKYTLSGVLGCASASANATVVVIAAPNAGHGNTAIFCSDGPPVSLQPYIGMADPAGTWRKPAPGNQVFSGTYVPATFDPGDYTYTVSGSAPCSAAVTVLHVQEVTGPNPGIPGVVTLCANDAPIDMTAALGGTPDPGTWYGPDNQARSNMFVPGLDPPGVYIYTVQASFPCVDKSSSLTVNVNPVPQAGGVVGHTVCENAPSFQLRDLLVGSTPGGQWFGPGMVPRPNGTFVPGIDPAGEYTYRVTGISPCAVAVGKVNVFVTPRPQAGRDTSVVLCANAAQVNLVNLLGGPHDLTGTWTGPSPSTAYFGGVFQPGQHTPGKYTYTVPGMPPCPAASASVTISIAQPPNAGQSRNISICSNAPMFAMVDSLGGSPQPSGTWWRMPSGPASNGIFSPAVPGNYTFRYIVQPTGVSPCAPDTAFLNIAVTGAPNAGNDGNLALCSTSGNTGLFGSLGGSPNSGGTWSYNQNGHSGTFNPGNDLPGDFAYTVLGTGGCKNDTAMVTVVVNQAPSAGSNGVRTICDDTLAAIVLRDVLNGSPATGGTWTHTDSGTPASEIYLPWNFSGGVHAFTYTVAGVAPCPAATAQATIIQNEKAVAGNNASLTLCTSDPSVDMFTLLGSSANPAGSWINSSGNYAPSTFNPANQVAGTQVFRYIVMGNAPCRNDTARVSITVNRKPNAGISTAPQLCNTGAVVSLGSLLGGTPDPGGSWAYHPVGGPAVPHDPTFDPATDPQGKYVYTVAGTAPCTNATATVQITLVPRPSAGTYGSMTVCTSETSLNLFAGLQGNPQAGGTWADLAGTGHMSNGVFNPSLAGPGTYRFRYTKPANGPCPADTASVRVTVTPELDAGNDASATLCLNQVTLLTPLLGGNPQPGGVWTGVENQNGLLNDVLNATEAGVGVHHYRYVLGGGGSCAPDSATLTVTIMNGPMAGHGVSIAVCSSTAELNLFNQLSPPFDTTGQWYRPNGTPMPSSVIVPGSWPQGNYHYIVPAVGACPADTATVAVSITTAANPGTNGSLSFCTNGAPGLLSAGLGGDPDPNGSWTFGNSSLQHGNVFNPLTDQAGNYFYTVPAQGPCPSATATVLVTKVPAPYAGGDNSYTFCSSDGPFNMFGKLALNPQTGGTWRRDGNPPTAHGATYDPAVDSSGVFLYIRAGTAPCANDTARLTVTEVRAPQAGNDATLTVCPTDSVIDLFAALGTGADTTGIWTDGANDTLATPLFNVALVTVGSYQFTYHVAGTAPCTDASASVTVNVGIGMNAGVGGNDTICGAQTAYNMFQSLGGNPDQGGVWSEQTGAGALNGNLLNATALIPGSAYPMAYTVTDPVCGQVQSVVFLYIMPYPDPGLDTTITVCVTGAPLDLNGLLRGAAPGGSWQAPDGTFFGGTFNPAVHPGGNYSYALQGNQVCADTAAVVTITVNQPADAGTDGAAQTCNSGTTQLFPLLGGSPQTGGQWWDLDGAGTLAGGGVDAAPLEPGLYRFHYRVEVEGCPADSAEVRLTVVDGVQVSGLERICNEQDRTYIVRFTISHGDPASYQVTGGGGSLSGAPPYVFTSTPFFTSEPFAFIVDDANQCAPVELEGVTPCVFGDAVFVPESFSPNGDGHNDKFVIPGIEGYPNNTISIFNRWGGEVYKGSGYDNRQVVWDGHSPNALIPGDASTGTYYYILDLGNGAEVIKGFVYLNR